LFATRPASDNLDVTKNFDLVWLTYINFL
jgi:hypothetical protein